MESLPRSTQTGRGRLSGPAPTPRQVREITVRITQVEPGVMQLSCPGFGWRSAQARNPQQLAALVAGAFSEAQVAAYSRFHRQRYDPDGYASPRRQSPGRRSSRSDVWDPRAWKEAPDGKWIAPGDGRRFRPDTRVVQQVQAKLAQMWEPATQQSSEER